MLDQIVFADHPLAVRHELQQPVENLGFERDQLIPAAQLAPLDSEQMVGKPLSQSRLPTRRWTPVILRAIRPYASLPRTGLRDAADRTAVCRPAIH